ncbi:MAG: NAD(P)H-hydrate dehydratase, partial [Spirochaetota bacterium]
NADFFSAAGELSRRYCCTAVLKGPVSVVCGKRSYIGAAGDPACATGGTGDILAGLCSSLSLRNISEDEAAAAAVWIHSLAARRSHLDKAPVIQATDIIGEIRSSLLPFYS